MAIFPADHLIFLTSLFDMKALMPFALFGVFAAVAWWMLERMAAGKPRVEERLDELKDPRKRSKQFARHVQ